MQSEQMRWSGWLSTLSRWQFKVRIEVETARSAPLKQVNRISLERKLPRF
jgi:hypothetical protein